MYIWYQRLSIGASVPTVWIKGHAEGMGLLLVLLPLWWLSFLLFTLLAPPSCYLNLLCHYLKFHPEFSYLSLPKPPETWLGSTSCHRQRAGSEEKIETCHCFICWGCQVATWILFPVPGSGGVDHQSYGQSSLSNKV